MSVQTVLIVDDHTLFRKGLAELIERRSNIRVVAATGRADEACRLVRECHPDALLLDLNLPPAGGLRLLECMRETSGPLPVTLILTVSEDEADLASALHAGVQGYLLKDMEPDEVIDAMQRAARGETVVAPAMTGKLVQLLQAAETRSAEHDLVASLTPREREVLAHLAQGASNKAIAKLLDISPDTVKLHVRHILVKLSLASRVTAAVFAIKHNLAQSGPARGE